MSPEREGSWSYRHPVGVLPQPVRGSPALSTPQGGRVLVGRSILQLWLSASDTRFPDLIAWSSKNGRSPAETACELACLVQAGLLERCELSSDPHPAATLVPALVARRVSAVIVGYNSHKWLPGCFDSLFAQTNPVHDVVVVDNGSSDGTAEWLEAAHPEVRLVRLPSTGSFAAAVNIGISAAQGEAYLVLNPDVVLEKTALAHLLDGAEGDPRCAAVAAKLRFLWAPAFLNGLGNFVGAAGYGTDSALGHLDLGQFDHWSEIPSACFAAALVSRAAVEAVGMLDAGFPMYYEDSEWCYRARLLGYRIRAAPQAVVYHAFSGRVPSGEDSGLPPLKLRRVTYGRLRFISHLLSEKGQQRFLRRYRLEDDLRKIPAVIGRQSDICRAYTLGWKDYHADLPEILKSRIDLQNRRVIEDDALFAIQRQTPPPLMRGGLPLLTADVIRAHYSAWLLGAGRVRFPETAALPPQAHIPSAPVLRRAASIARDEGVAALFHRAAKALLWRLQSDV